MAFKIVWTVIASLAVITQVPMMIESYRFNQCYNKALEFYLQRYGDEKPEPYASRKNLMHAFNYCQGGDW